MSAQIESAKAHMPVHLAIFYISMRIAHTSRHNHAQVQTPVGTQTRISTHMNAAEFTPNVEVSAHVYRRATMCGLCGHVRRHARRHLSHVM